MHYFSLRLAIVTLSISLMVLGGCASSQPSRFYLLAPLPSSAPSVLSPALDSPIAIGVGPVVLPGYLDRPQIVTRSSRNQLELAEFERWGESLQDNFTRVLAENLSVLIPTDYVFIHPWERSTPVDYQVTIEVIRFDAAVAGNSTLLAHWNIFRDENGELLLTRKSSFSEPASAGDYSMTVAAMNRNIEDLSREIAKTLNAVAKNPVRATPRDL